jgi:hypothetical protein
MGKCSWYTAHRHNHAKLVVVQVMYLGYDESIGPCVVTEKEASGVICISVNLRL